MHIAAGTRAKLDFDFACQRGHSFGEYHVHGVVNEILCSNLDPTRHRVHSGFAHPELQEASAGGRPREVDFAVEILGNAMPALCVEVKWAGSSHCTQETVLRDLCRLQLIKNAKPRTDCIFVLAGHVVDVDRLFSSNILLQGTTCLLHRTGDGVSIKNHGRHRRVKHFSLENNSDHAMSLMTMIPKISAKLPKLPQSIFTFLINSARSAPKNARFHVLVWAVEVSTS